MKLAQARIVTNDVPGLTRFYREVAERLWRISAGLVGLHTAGEAAAQGTSVEVSSWRAA